MTGIPIVERGRDTYGVFPLRGKLLNVREATAKQRLDNQEITQLKQILGLQEGKHYTNIDSLRYGHICILVDADTDGTHIKGLILNWLEASYPSLLKLPGFLLDFKSPIVKCTQGKTDLFFYSLRDYENWKRDNAANHGWSVKYLKGLATSEDKDIKKYFKALENHLKSFDPLTNDDSEKLDLVFSKKRAGDRKEWLQGYNRNVFLDDSMKHIPIKDFIDKAFIEFSMYDNIRSIPSMVDGLKPGQRKILYTVLKTNLRSEIKVAQLSGKVSEMTEYRHGEQSLNETITGMAQRFIGSNNIPLLYPRGAFGTRRQGGKDAGSPRYIYTHLQTITRMIFPKVDDNIVNYQFEDGKEIEPVHYIPVLPMILINGTEGIGSGYSTQVMCYNPNEIMAALIKRSNGSTIIGQKFAPWYRGYTGDVQEIESGKWIFSGKVQRTGDNILEITELPVHTWIEKYKEYLEKLIETDVIKDYKEYHTNTKVHFVIRTSIEGMKLLCGGDQGTNETTIQEELIKNLKLTAIKHSTNMMLFDQYGKLKKYENVADILEEFYIIRLAAYGKRKQFQLNSLKQELLILENKCCFIEGIISDEIQINNKKKLEVYDILSKKHFQVSESNDGYGYLLNMPFHSLTKEKVDSLKEDIISKKEEYARLEKITLEEMYREELAKVEKELISYEADWWDAQKDDDDTDNNGIKTNKRKAKSKEAGKNKLMKK
jgi:DNA topoisomerase-2